MATESLEEVIARHDALVIENRRLQEAWVAEAERANNAVADVERLRTFCEHKFNRPLVNLSDIADYLVMCQQQAKSAAKEPYADGLREGEFRGRAAAYRLVKDLLKKLHKNDRITGHAWAVIDDALDDAIMEGWHAED